MLLLYAVTLFVSAALLFCVQPMVAKMILPLLGGTPAVWNTCMVFFQAALLGGYLYSHLLTTWFEKRTQVIIHAALLLLPFLVLPIMISDTAVRSLSPTDNPIPWVLHVLITAVGLPFFMLSATAPLLQKWFAETGHSAAKDPYFLYGASNLGSMLALGSYPVLIEPSLSLVDQGDAWTIGYAVLALLILGCAAVAWKRRGGEWESGRVGERESGREGENESVSFSPSPPLSLSPSLSAVAPTFWRRIRWIGLAFVPSSLMLGVTTYLTTDIAAIPLLWVIPLALYLLTFIIVFARKPLLRHEWINYAMIVAVIVFPVLYYNKLAKLEVMALHLVIFFIVSMYCHGELARDRPSTKYLTEFYLWMSFGGMLGGMFNGLAAPLLFNRTLEYSIAMVIACLVRPWPREGKNQGLQYLLDLAIPPAMILFMAVAKGQLTDGIMLFLVLVGGGTLAFSLWSKSRDAKRETMEESERLAGAPDKRFQWPAFLRRLFPQGSSPAQWLRPFGLAFIPASLMIGLPTALHTRTEAPLWAIAAALYATSLALALSNSPFLFRRGWLDHAMGIALIAFPIPYYFKMPLPEWVLSHLVIFFIVSLYCHRELAKETWGRFFAWLLVGGGLGIAFNLRVAPLVFSSVLEFPIAMLIACLLRPWPSISRTRWLYSLLDFVVPPLILLATMIILRTQLDVTMTTKNWGVLIGILATGCLLFINRPLRLGLAIAVLLLVPEDRLWFQGDTRGVLYQTRSFFGVLKVSGSESHHSLVHGNILHGRQDFGEFRREPGTYYYRTGPLGDVMKVFAARRSKPTIAAIGLGTGSVAAYPKKGEQLTFYEIDPAVERIARDPELFTYLHDCEGDWKIVLGDARLRLEEAPDGAYGVIIVDAFSSDSIPVHLLTKEAIQLYFRKLAKHGILTMHTSNRYLNLRPVVAELARDGGYAGRVRSGKPTDEEKKREYSSAEWVVFAREEADLGEIAGDSNWEPLLEDRRGPVWTDDFSNIFSILRFRWRDD